MGDQRERSLDPSIDPQREEVHRENRGEGATHLPHDPSADKPRVLSAVPGKTRQGPSAACKHCAGNSDTAEHTLFECEYWRGHRTDLEARLGHQPAADDLPDILCGPDFDLLPADPEERANLLAEAGERLRLFYRMVESIMSLKEEEERVRQAFEPRRRRRRR